MIVKTFFLCNVSIRHNLCLKLQKVDKGEGTRHKKPKLRVQHLSLFQHFKNYLRPIETRTKNGVHHNLVFMLNLNILCICKITYTGGSVDTRVYDEFKTAQRSGKVH